MIDLISNIDYAIFDFMTNYLSSPLMDNLMIFSTKLGDFGLIWIIIAVAMAFKKKYRPYLLMVGVAVLFSCLFSEYFIKFIFERPRPFVTNPDFNLIIPIPHGEFSFPSSHTVTSFAAATSLVFVNKKFLWTYIFAFLIGFSRIYLLVHYPSDVFAGAIIGTVLAVLVCMFALKKFGKVLKKFEKYN